VALVQAQRFLVVYHRLLWCSQLFVCLRQVEEDVGLGVGSLVLCGLSENLDSFLGQPLLEAELAQQRIQLWVLRLDLERLFDVNDGFLRLLQLLEEDR